MDAASRQPDPARKEHSRVHLPQRIKGSTVRCVGHLDGSGVVLYHPIKKQPLPVARTRLVELLHLVLIQHAVQAAVMCAPSR